MNTYFVTANIWLVVGFALYLGRTTSKSEIDTDPRYAVFNGDSAVYMTYQSYMTMVLAVFLIAGVFFFLSRRETAVPVPNNALQRTGIGGGASSDLDA